MQIKNIELSLYIYQNGKNFKNIIIIPNALKHAETVAGKQNGTASVKNWQFLNKNKQANIVRPSDFNSIPEHLFQKNTELYSYINPYKNVHSSFICNDSKQETTQRFFKGQMVEQPVVQSILWNTTPKQK
jgi:hypothetical protein